MPRKQSLKVFRTPIGFHDAYVAAPSQKAALEAWGSDANLFARGVAERVDDPALMREPLAKPGTVIRRLRGTTAEQLASLPPDPPKRRTPAHGKNNHTKATPKAQSRPKPKPKPKPDRGALDETEQALAEIEARQARERDALKRRQAELDRKRRALEKRQEAESARATRRAEKVREAYERALRAWRG